MIVLMARYRVGDVGRFLDVFREFEQTRRDSGATGRRVLGSLDDPTRVVAEIEFASREEAEAFAGGAARAAALDEAGVLERADEILEEMAP